MGQEENDLDQVQDCIKTLANVYKSQATDGIMDNGNLQNINSAIMTLKNVESWMIAHGVGQAE